MQMGFMPGRGTTDAIFILRQLLEKYEMAGRDLYVVFVDLEKAFDHVPREVIWWSLRRKGVLERNKSDNGNVYKYWNICQGGIH